MNIQSITAGCSVTYSFQQAGDLDSAKAGPALFKGFGLAALLALTVTHPAQAQNSRTYGLGAPFQVENLPAGILRSQLRALPPPAQKRALGWLHRINIPAPDVSALRVDYNGGVFYEDPIFESEVTETASSSKPSLENITQAKAFSLHSKPGASRTVYLDMDGHMVSGTIWNWNAKANSLLMRPYDTDGDETSFSQSELNDIAETWKRVAEDFAPYDIDVTTEAPASFGPDTGHILVTPQTDESGRKIYNCNCGGVAYVDVWGQSNFPYYQPALVFLDGVGGPQSISEAASHELGHNLSLTHDGTSTVNYYDGHGTGHTNWGPIMGVGYYAHVTQWSQGEYADANNTQDDLQLIADRLSYRADDHEDNDFTKATPLVVSNDVEVLASNPVTDPDNIDPANKGLIEDRSDVDLFYVDVGDGDLSLTVTPAWTDDYTDQYYRGANLDIQAALYDENGMLVTQSDRHDDTYAQLNTFVTTGRYYLAITGAGTGDSLTNGYSDYASLGQYFIAGTVPADLYTSAPPAPTDLTAQQSGDTGIVLSWTDPASEASNNEDGYRVYRQIESAPAVLIATLAQGSNNYTDNNLVPGSYIYYVEAFNSAGSNTSNNTLPIVISTPDVPGQPTLLSPNGTITDNTPTYTWEAIANADEYKLLVYDSTGVVISRWYSAEKAGCSEGTGTCSLTPKKVLADGNGKWKVKGRNETDTGRYSKRLEFTVASDGGVPAKPTLISPNGNITDNTPTYTWEAIANADEYKLLVYDSTGVVISRWYSAEKAGCNSGTGSCAITLTKALAKGSGKWKVKGKNEYGTGLYGKRLTFTVE